MESEVERAKGRWLNGYDYEYEFAYCSECGRMQWTGWNTHAEAREMVVDFHKCFRFCPGCGARMTGGEYIEGEFREREATNEP